MTTQDLFKGCKSYQHARFLNLGPYNGISERWSDAKCALVLCWLDQTIVEVNHSWWPVLNSGDKTPDLTEWRLKSRLWKPTERLSCFFMRMEVLITLDIFTKSDLLLKFLRGVKTFQSHVRLQQFQVNPIILVQLHTFTTHSSCLVTLNMIYSRGCSKGGQESPTVYQVYICKVFFLLQPSAEE